MLISMKAQNNCELCGIGSRVMYKQMDIIIVRYDKCPLCGTTIDSPNTKWKKKVNRWVFDNHQNYVMVCIKDKLFRMIKKGGDFNVLATSIKESNGEE